MGFWNSSFVGLRDEQLLREDAGFEEAEIPMLGNSAMASDQRPPKMAAWNSSVVDGARE